MNKTIKYAVGLLFGLALAWSVLGCSDDDKSITPGNNPPAILSLTADLTTLHIGDVSTFTVIAEDPDGDELSYGWEHRDGGSNLEWVSASGNSAVLTTCGCTIVDPLYAWVIATVNDGKGGRAQDSLAIVVLPNETE